METLRSESILKFEANGLTASAPVETPADGDLIVTNSITRTYVATSDADIATAAAEFLTAARDAGWTGPDFADPGDNGVFGTTLEKGEATLDATYKTTRSFDLLPNDDDEISLVVRVQSAA